MIEHQIEGRILAGHGEGPVEETPSGTTKPAKDQDRIAHSHEAYLRRVSRPLGVCVRRFVRSLPAGINETGATPERGVVTGGTNPGTNPPPCVPIQRQKGGGRSRPARSGWCGTFWPGSSRQTTAAQQHMDMGVGTNPNRFVEHTPPDYVPGWIVTFRDPGLNKKRYSHDAVHRSTSCILKRLETQVS